MTQFEQSCQFVIQPALNYEQLIWQPTG